MFYKLMRGIATVLLKWPCRVKYEGLENIPASGSVIFIANHQHFGDPVLLALGTKREVSFLGKDQLFKGPLATAFFKSLHVIPLNREALDRTALREAIATLKAGGALGVFPEGTRSKDGKLLPFKAGICFIASQSPCMIVPVGITYEAGLFHYFSKPVRVKVGEPFPYLAQPGEKRKETQERMLKKQEEAVLALLTNKGTVAV